MVCGARVVWSRWKWDSLTRGADEMPAKWVERFKVRFPDQESLQASQAVEAQILDVNVANMKRNFIGVGLPEAGAKTGGALQVETVTADLDKELAIFEREYGAEVVVDYQYALEQVGPEEFPLPVGPEVAESPTLDDVLDQISARRAWKTVRGENAVIAVVDTGVNGARPEFPMSKRTGEWAPIGEDAWNDYLGHGPTCACIATATRDADGEFDGMLELR